MIDRNEIKDPEDIVIVFKKVRFCCHLNPVVFSEKDRKEIVEILSVVSEEIRIDKTFVEFDGSPYEKTFMFEEGWSALCLMLAANGYGENATEAEREVMNEAYRMMAVCYVEDFLEDLGFDARDLKIDVQDGTSFDVEYHVDTVREWKTYPGRWQTWKKQPDDPSAAEKVLKFFKKNRN